jgi:ATP-dependent helicase/nuclease subunit A
VSGLTIYKSSAGSGKTFTLVKSYLQIVIRNPWAYRHVLAITFTNKATEEMKARIIGALSELASSSGKDLADNPYFQDLRDYLAEVEPDKDIDISHQARTVLNLILNDYSNFSVSTIESFFQRIIRAFTRELNIPLGYEIEMQQDLVLERIVDEVFLEIGRKKDLTRLLTGFVERNLDEERSWNIHLEVKKLADQVFKEKYQRLLVEYPEEENKRIDRTLDLVKRLQTIKARFENYLKQRAMAALELLEAYNLQPSDFKHGRSSVAQYFVRVSQKHDFDPKARATKVAVEGANEWYGKTTAKASEIEVVLDAGLQSLLEEMVSFYQNKQKEYYSALQILRTLHTFGLLQDLQKKLAEYRRENNQLIISDTAYLIKEIINSQYDTPFIYEKVGNRYQYYLIDEFQDTSDMQWNNLFPLVLEALGQGNGGLVVGDVKQSIYRWRNGNMELLMHLVEEEIARRRQTYQVEDLSSNWRTGATIVHFNNEFFRMAAEIIAAEFAEESGAKILAAYAGASQEPQRHFPSYVEVDLLGKEGELDWKEEALEKSMDLIRELTKQGFQGKEITLLVRRNQEGVMLAEYLQSQGQKVISAESLLVGNHPKVILLLAFLKVLVDETNEVALASLRFYLRQVLYPTAGTDHRDFIAEEKIPDEFVSKLPQLRSLPVYQCVERLLHFVPPLQEPNAYVQGFLDKVLQYSSTEDASISGFLNYWEEVSYKSAIASAPDPESVQIMTIHKAKGLEFPVVIVPFANWELGPSLRDFIWVEELLEQPYEDFPFLPVPISSQLESTYFSSAYGTEKLLSYLDNLNLLYVALTRPEIRLYLFAPYDAHKDKKRGKRRLKSVDHLVNLILDNGGIEGEWDGDGTRFRIGEAAHREKISHKNKAERDDAVRSLRPNPRPHDDWNQAVRVRFHSNRYLPTDFLAQSEKISVGELIHHALSFVETADDLARAVKHVVGKGYLSQDQAPGLEQQLERIVHHPPAASWYDGSWQVKNEAEIILQKGSILRPDRVMIRQGKAVVVDYKSGQVSDRYRGQILQYMQALAQMNYQEVEGYLYYINLGIVERV